MTRWLNRVATVLAVALLLFFLIAPGQVDRRMNRVAGDAGPAPSADAQRMYDTLAVADLHADVLLWARNIRYRYDRGHIDLPRLQDAGVALQVFSAVTRVPTGLNYERNSATGGDLITWLALTEWWPPHTWFSLRNRALYQAAKLDRFASDSDGQLVVIHSREDLEVFLRRRQASPRMVAGVLSLEGLHAMEGRMDALQALFNAGYRLFGLAHFFDNEVAGSAHGEAQGGLTPLGREALAWMEAHRAIVDLAHSSPATVDEVLDLATRPIVVSHTGVQGTCPGPRNLTDAQIDRIAAKGGLIGIGFWDAAVCELSAASIARALRYTADRAGVDHVALGSDFDGATTTPFDATGLPHLVPALLQEGFSGAEVGQIMGGNVIRFLRENLPEDTAGP
ncbi:MAG: membrane dipeptidase [Rhodothermales bacterium]